MNFTALSHIFKPGLLGWSLCLSMLFIPLLAQASILSYTSQNAFNAKVVNAGMDTFNDLSTGGGQANPQQRNAGVQNYLISSDTFVSDAGGGDMLLANAYLNEMLSLTINSQLVRAVGALFFATDEAGNFLANQSIVVTVTDIDGLHRSQSIMNAMGTSFLGFTSDRAIASVTVQSLQNGVNSWATMNNLILAEVSEPVSPALFILGLSGLLLIQKRRVK